MGKYVEFDLCFSAHDGNVGIQYSLVHHPSCSPSQWFSMDQAIYPPPVSFFGFSYELQSPF